MVLLNLEKQLVFYGQYHHDPVNVAIHMIFVPILLWTGILMAASIPYTAPLPENYTLPYLAPNIGTIAAFVYGSLYCLMEPVAGPPLALLVIGFGASSNYLVGEHGDTAVQIAAGVHVFSWIAQFIGHGKFEGRAPALLDNLVQAIFLAPLFVWLEALFAIGYRPELKSRLDKDVACQLEKFRGTKEEKGKGKLAKPNKKSQ